MEQHLSEEQMMFCVDSVTYLLDVTPSEPIAKQINVYKIKC